MMMTYSRVIMPEYVIYVVYVKESGGVRVTLSLAKFARVPRK